MKNKNIARFALLTPILLLFNINIFAQSGKQKASWVDFFLGTSLFADYETGAGVKFTGHFRHMNVPSNMLDNPYIGIGVTEKSLHTELGVRPNLFDPNIYNDCFRSHAILGLTWKYYADFYKGHLVSETFEDPPTMFLAPQMGVDIEYGRFGAFIVGHPGISWTPTKKFKWKDNGYWDYSVEGGVYFLFGFFKKK